MSEYLTVRETAKLLNYHPRWVRERIKQKRLKAFKREGRWLVEKSSILPYIKSLPKGKRRGRLRKEGKHDKPKGKP